MDWPPELSEALGPGRLGAPLGSGVYRACAGDAEMVVKMTAAAPDEAAGLKRLAAVEEGPRVPSVLYCSDAMLAIEWIPPGPPGPGGDAQLGRALAGLHSTTEESWGGGSSWIGDCRVDPSPAGSAAEFYGRRLGALATRCGLDGPVGRVVDRLDDLIPPGPPGLLHGDLWWGNVLWAHDGGPVLIDPSVHAGHPEEDLAMLALFGPVPARLYDAYLERRHLDDGWRDRSEFWQLYPLLVHAVLFGSSYRSSALAVARRYG